MRKLHIEWYGESINAFGNNIRAKEGDVTSMTFLAQKGQEFIHNLCKRFLDTVWSVQKEGNYTEQGQLAKIQETANKLLTELKQNYRRFLYPIIITYQISKFRTTARALQPPRDATEAIQRLKIQRYLRSLDIKQRVKVFQDALMKNNESILAVFFERPALFKLLEPKFIKKGKRQYLAKAAPDAIAAEEAGSMLTFNIERVVDDLSLYAGQLNDAAEILSFLPKLDWTFEPTSDTKAMAGGAFTSNLPEPILSMSDWQWLEELKKAGKKR